MTATSGRRLRDPAEAGPPAAEAGVRHSYATWLVTEGVPVNIVRKVMGHEQTSTTLDLYTHTPADYESRVLAAFDDSAAFSPPLELNDQPEGDGDDSEDVV